ncbi:hypothetical protein [Candidatus Nitrotoga sp. AM1P]|uniref:hypothetical protein n=1 Tax=Candidatus Nitrotoga sp. AM1P TaxID=2559597 RepID=UPI0010BC8A76|nr:hypothetical protein [Candidatus Nitrotoga sp. AM1P]BBJ23463.1 hypothetical protein W01_13900 [Candidatus Nitrotoga sp. AM1P]
MYKASVGFHRLGILVGTISVIGWVTYVAIASDGFTSVNPVGWVAIPTVGLAFFAFGYGIIVGIHWVKSGFQNGD